MSTRTALTVVGGVVGAYFGYPQLGLLVGSLVGGAVDPTRIEGPQINETGVQTSAEGVQRPIVWGTIDVTGNIIQKGELVHYETEEDVGGKGGGTETTTDHVARTYAIRICEGPIAAVLRIWADNKLVYDMRTGSAMIAESQKWVANKLIYLGDEAQVADPTLVSTVNADTPAYRGTAYIVFVQENLDERAGSIPQYRFEVANSVTRVPGSMLVGPTALRGSYLDVDSSGRPFIIDNQTTGAGTYGVDNPGSYQVNFYEEDFQTLDESTLIVNSGLGVTQDIAGRIWPMAATEDGGAVSFFGNTGYLTYLIGGAVQSNFAPTAPVVATWRFNEEGNAPTPMFGALVWFRGGFAFVGTSKTSFGSWNRIDKFALSAGTVTPTASITGLDSNTTSPVLWMHMSRAGYLRLITSDGVARTYDQNLTLQSTDTLPAAIAARFPHPQAIHGFGVDEAKDYAVYVYFVSSTSRVDVYRHSTGELLATHTLAGIGSTPYTTRVVFNDSYAYIQRHNHFFALEVPETFTPGAALLSEIVSDIYERCDVGSALYDVTELTDEVAGFLCANAYTGADAIGKLIQGYQFDISGHDSKNYHPKRGAAVIETLTIDDLIERPDTNTREQAIERPKKLHLRYKHAASGYAAVKATAPRANSPDVLTTGEAIIELPVVLDENEAARKADIMYKIVSAEVAGETEVSVPFRVGAKYVTGNALGLFLRGIVTRNRITRMEFQPWRVKLTLSPDRQSAYTSTLTGVPIPPPELPPSTIIGGTRLAVLDIAARTDSEDDLNYYVAVSGALPPWYGARYQRSLDGGASYSTVLDIRTASIMGELTNNITDMSEHFTDTTNVMNVSLFRDSQSLESISDESLLSQGNPFALEKADGSWEIMQFRDAVQDSDGTWTLSYLHRGQLNSGTSAHTAGARFVMLQRPSHIPASSAWLNVDLTHRAISLGESADDTDNEETHTYVGRSQTEWEPAYLYLQRDTATNAITATWVGRGRFGTGLNPVMSANFRGYRVTATDGTTTETIETTDESYSGTWAAPVTITVVALNRITGAGPASTGTV